MKFLPVSKWQAGGYSRREVITGVVFLLLLIPVWRNLSCENDIDIFYLAATELRNGGNPYDGPHLYGMWYYYSPLFASLLIPFTYLPMFAVKLVWMLTGFLLLNRIYVLIRKFLDIPDNQSGFVYTCIFGFLAYNPVFLNLLHGQMTILMVWCILEGAWQNMHRQWKWGSLCFAIGINIKILPIFLGWLYLVKKDFRMLAATGVSIILLILIPYLWFNPAFHTSIIQDWLGLLNPLNKEHVNTIGEGGFTDFASLLTKYFSGIRIRGESDFNMAIWSTKTIFWVQWAYRLLLIGLCAWFVNFTRLSVVHEKVKLFAQLAFFMVCIPSAFPHQRDYSAMLLTPAMGFMLYTAIIQKIKPQRWLLILAFLAAFAIGSVVFFPLTPWKFRHFMMEARIPGMGYILFIPVYIIWVKNYLSKVVAAE
jgi:hypothetical protein